VAIRPQFRANGPVGYCEFCEAQNTRGYLGVRGPKVLDKLGLHREDAIVIAMRVTLRRITMRSYGRVPPQHRAPCSR